MGGRGMEEFRAKISVVVPCYNVEKYIEQCVESVINQTIGIENIELILIDDASVDGTVLKIMQYVKKYPDNIIFIRLKKNAGQANARNIGMDMVRSPFFFFLDSDDWISLDYCEKMLQAASEEVFDLVQCGYKEYKEYADIELIEKEILADDEGIKKIVIDTITERKEFMKNYGLAGVIGRTVFRTAWIRQAKIRFAYFTKYEDNYFSSLIQFQFHTICFVPECMYYYRILKKSNSHARNDEGHFERLSVELELIKYYQINGFFDLYYEEIRDQFIYRFYRNTLHIIFCQFDELPMELIKSMQQTVTSLFPDYMKSFKMEENILDDLSLTLLYDFPQSVLEQLRQGYLDWLIEGRYENYAKLLARMWRSWGISQIEKNCK